jgi:amidase
MSVAAAMTVSASPAGAQQGQFRLQEATIAGIHAALAAGRLTCTQLTSLYLDRIAAYNMQGPALHAIITVNPKAMEIAVEMDRPRPRRGQRGDRSRVPHAKTRDAMAGAAAAGTW